MFGNYSKAIYTWLYKLVHQYLFILYLNAFVAAISHTVISKTANHKRVSVNRTHTKSMMPWISVATLY